MPEAGPAVLAMGHPPSLLAALALVAASEQPVRCVLNIELGFWARALAGWVGMIAPQVAGDGEEAAVSAAQDALAAGEIVACFSNPGIGSPGDTQAPVQGMRRIAIDKGLLESIPSGTALFPVHLYIPGESEPSRDLLICLGTPLVADGSPAGNASAVHARGFAHALDAALRQNVFGLMENEVQLFLSDLEQILIEDLEEEWAARPDWKQKTEGFRLSQFLAECLMDLNSSHPSRVVVLRDRLERYQEARRRWSLGQAEVEAARPWLDPAATRLWYWFESIVGLPVAFYGFVNHLLALAILKWRGLLDGKEAEADPTGQWILRVLVIVGCYAAQISVCAYALGRAAAGYYALTLPLAGGYLWRYRWLASARTRLLLLAARLPRGKAKLRQLRRELVAEINASRDAYAKTVGTPD